MFDRILVPLDGSSLAEAILPAVSKLAAALGSEVVLLHVLEEKPPARVHGEPHLTTASGADTYLAEVATRLMVVTVEHHVHDEPVDDVAAAISAHAQELSIGLIAMCRHGRSGMREFVIGSIAQQVLRRVDTPVMLLRAAHGEERPFDATHTLLPIDPRHDPDAALGVAVPLTAALHGRLTLLSVIPDLSSVRGSDPSARLLPGATQATLDMERQEFAWQLENYTKQWAHPGLEIEALVGAGDPAPSILTTARSLDAGLIVLSTHGRGGLEAWMEGSTGARVIAESSQVLLLLKQR